MQSYLGIPWNLKAKNGTKAFFSEESYAKWFGRETHETRLADNLKKLGINVKQEEFNKRATCTIEPNTVALKSEEYEKDAQIDDETIITTGPVKPHKNPVRLTKRRQQCTLTKSATSLPEETSKNSPRIIQEQTNEQIERNKKDYFTVPKSIGSQRVCSQKLNTTSTASNRKDVDESCASLSSLTHKTGSTVKTNPYEKTESLVGGTSGVCSVKVSSAALDGNVPRPEAVPIAEITKPTEEVELKKLHHDNLLYFNKQDRAKYIPNVFKHKPRHRKSELTHEEMTKYLDLYSKYGHLDLPSSPKPGQSAELNNFQRLARIIQQEQRRYQAYLKGVAYKLCEEDYKYLHPTADKYIKAKLLHRKRRVSQYPRFYIKVCTFSLLNDAPEDTPSLQYVRPLLEMGSVCRLQLPVIVSGCPQPCTPTEYKEVSSVCPPIPPSIVGHHVWHHEECSQDINAEQLAVPNKCDIVLSACSLKHLIDNQGKAGKCWSMPVTVREYQITEGDKQITHRVVYLDKPLIKMKEYNARDKNMMFQKYALRTAAMRKKQKMITFSKVCPVSEIKDAPTVQQVTKDLDNWEKTVKSSEQRLENLSSESEEESSEEDESKRRFFRKPKYTQRFVASDKNTSGNENVDSKVKGCGVFDVEKDIDDLESFGMTSPKSFKESKEVFTQVKTGESLRKKEINKRKSLDSDLDMFKKELMGIKELAKKDVKKNTESIQEPRQAVKQLGHINDDKKPAITSSEDIPSTGNSEPSVEQEQAADIPVEIQDGQNGQIIRVDNESTKPDNEKLDAEQFTIAENKPVTRNIGRSRAKNTHSLSTFMEKMSTVKAKLKEREQTKGGSNVLSTETIPKPHLTYDSSGSYTLRTRKAAKTAVSPMVNLGPTDSDSDTETDGLVIDLPESPKKKAKLTNQGSGRTSMISDRPDKNLVSEDSAESKAIHETIESPPASPVMELNVPESPDFEAPQSPDNTVNVEDSILPKTCVIIPLDESGSETVVRDYSEVKYEPVGNQGELGQQMDAKMEETKEEQPESLDSDKYLDDPIENSPVKTRGSKRKSADGNLAELKTSKRVLRSKVPKEERETGEDTAKGLDDVDKQHPADTTEAVEEATFIQTRGRGRKRELVTERVTRSRSVSMDTTSNNDNSPARGAGRVTRNSVDSLIAKPEVPVKRKRGRPSMKSDTVDIDTEAIDNLDEPNLITDREDTNPPESDKIVRHEKDENEQKDKVRTPPKRRGRPPKRLAEETKEAQKVKELAKNLKKKLAKQNPMEEKLTSNEPENVIKDNIENLDTNLNDNKIESAAMIDTTRSNATKLTDTTRPDATNWMYQERGDSSGDTGRGASGQTGAVGSLESILNMQTELLKPTTASSGAKPASQHDKFASQHGMSHVKFPVEGNVTYHQWSLGDTRVVVRCSFHGHAGPQGVVHISPKMEYQPCFGYEQVNNNEVARNWMSVYVRPNSSLIRTRINPFNSEIMKLEHVGFTDLIPSYSSFKPLLAFADMNTVFQKLKSLSVGQYILRNRPSEGKLVILKESEAEQANFDLYRHHASYNTGGREVQRVQWCPIDPRLLLPHQKRSRLIPLIFPLKGGIKHMPPQNRGKKKKKSRRKFNKAAADTEDSP